MQGETLTQKQAVEWAIAKGVTLSEYINAQLEWSFGDVVYYEQFKAWLDKLDK